jgi:hypothetical protein
LRHDDVTVERLNVSELWKNEIGTAPYGVIL